MRFAVRCFLPLLVASFALAAESALKSISATPGWRYEELRRFKAPEAGQGVAVDAEFFYAINNRTIAKYRKASGERVAIWEGAKDGPISHLNAGLVREGRLYTVHSNFPAVPMLSSLEVFDPATLRPIATHSFGRVDGSFTWLDRHEVPTASGPRVRWVACFVHYGNRGGEPGRDPTWTQIIAFDDEWRRTAGWGLPRELIARFGDRGYSASGGAFGPGGFLYLTGHDNPELYVLAFPAAGSVLRWIATVPIPAEGQAFAWDPVERGVLYTILRRTKEVMVGRVTAP